jgi:putative ABC transport system permease protein
MSFLEILRTAVFALRGNWLRSALTSLGVIIGIAAVIVMVSVGQGTQAEIDKLVSGLGSNRLDIGGAGGFGGGGARIAAGSRYTLDEADAEAIRDEIPEVQYVAASLRGGTQVVYAESNWSTQWQGVQPDFFAINGWDVQDGNGFETRDYNGGKVVILGETVRRELFADEDAIGQTVRIGRVPFTVAGILKPKGQGGFGQDQDDVVLVPLETARRRLMGASTVPPGAVQQIALGVTRAEDVAYVQGEVEALLRQRHRIQPGDNDDFSVRNIAEVVATRTQATRLMSLLLGRGGDDLADRRRHRHHEHHAGVGDRAHPRDRVAHGSWRGAIGHPPAVPGGSHADLADRRSDRHSAGHGGGTARGTLRLAAGGAERASGCAGGRLLDRDRAVLRLLPGAQGIAARPDRGAAPAMTS